MTSDFPSAKIIQLKTANVMATKIALAETDQVAMTILVHACSQANIIAKALHDTGRSEAANKIFQGLLLVMEGHGMVVKDVIKRMET